MWVSMLATQRRIDTVPPHHLSVVEGRNLYRRERREDNKSMVLVFLIDLRASVVKTLPAAVVSNPRVDSRPTICSIDDAAKLVQGLAKTSQRIGKYGRYIISIH